jgi:hypothetical protein
MALYRCVLLLTVVTAVLADDLVVLKQGRLKGHRLTTRKGREIFAFQGIPYAKPPVGKLRFQVKSTAVRQFLSANRSGSAKDTVWGQTGPRILDTLIYGEVQSERWGAFVWTSADHKHTQFAHSHAKCTISWLTKLLLYRDILRGHSSHCPPTYAYVYEQS